MGAGTIWMVGEGRDRTEVVMMRISGMAVMVFLSVPSLALSGTDSMVFPKENWRETSPESQGMDSDRLTEAIGYLEEHSGKDGVRELVIIRNGFLIWKGDNIDKVHGVWSLTKSFTSTALGLLVDDGKASLDTLAKDHVFSMKELYPTVTLRHFTTMTSGYRAVGDKTDGGYKHGPSPTPFQPAEPLFTPPGSKYAYWDSAMNQFANVLTRIAGESIEDLFKRRIAHKIDMNSEKWHWGDFGKVDGIVVNGGAGNNSNHVYICARELARFGLLFLNRGSWEGEQLLSSSWIEKAASVQVQAFIPLAAPELSPFDGTGYYGFNWWCNGTSKDGKRKWPGATEGTYAASGYNNNDMFVIPEWQMVIVRLGLDQRDDPISDSEYGTFLKMVGEAIRSEK